MHVNVLSQMQHIYPVTALELLSLCVIISSASFSLPICSSKLPSLTAQYSTLSMSLDK